MSALRPPLTASSETIAGPGGQGAILPDTRLPEQRASCTVLSRFEEQRQDFRAHHTLEERIPLADSRRMLWDRWQGLLIELMTSQRRTKDWRGVVSELGHRSKSSTLTQPLNSPFHDHNWDGDRSLLHINLAGRSEGQQ